MNRRFLYLRISSNADIRGIYDGIIGVTPREQPSQRILGAQFGAIYVPSPGSDTGRLLFLRESTLMTQPFDTGRLELTGEPVPIAEQVGAAGSGGKWMVSNGGGGQPRWRADGKEMRTAAGHAGQPMGYDSRRSKTPVQQQRNRNCHGADNGRPELAGDS
ncbi:MAG: hypothetical protein HYU27_05510 [Acidobacteria bacterium]|nr:hypothetical protein [Acidobacteriota bacterium]